MVSKYFNRVTVSGASFPGTPDVNIGFQCSISVINEGTGIVEYSFDGSTLHGDLVPGTGSQEIVFEQTSLNVMWFRLKSGSACTVRVEGSDTQLQVGSAASTGGGSSSNLSVVPNFTAGSPGYVTAIGAYSSVGDDIVSLQISDSSNGLLVEQQGPISIAGGVDINSSTLPTGASTAALQTTLNTKINGGLPAALGTGGGLKIDGSGTALPISGSVTVSGTVTSNIGTSGSLALDATLTGGSQKTQVSAPLPAGTNVIGHVITDTGSTVSVSNFPATQPVSGSISLGAAIPAGTNVIGHVISDTGSTVAVSNFPATQPVSGTVTSNIGTSGSLALDASVTSLSAKFGSLGQKTMAGSAPVTIASDQGAIATTSTATVTGNVTVVGAAAAGSAASGNPVLVAGVDGSANARRILTTTTGLTRTTYDYGSVPGSSWLATAFASFAAVGQLVKTGAGVLRYFQFINNSGAAGNIQIFDRTTQPSAGAVPLVVSAIASASASTLNFFEGGVPFSTGIYIVMSSTLATYTAIASTAFTGVVVYA